MQIKTRESLDRILLTKDFDRIYSTREYGFFCRLEGNREVLYPRKKKIIESVRQRGQIRNPIIVNEKMEVIDGQGRLEAFKTLELPVDFIINEGLDYEDCIAMNIYQDGWKLIDYISCHAERGIEQYKELLQLIQVFSKSFKTSVILYALNSKQYNNHKLIKEGRFECTHDEFTYAQKKLSYLMTFIPIFTSLKGHNEYYYMALAYCYSDEEVDNDRLYEKMVYFQATLIPVTTITQALEQIEKIYNNHIRSKVYIKAKYQKDLDDKYAWYGKKYLDKKGETV